MARTQTLDDSTFASDPGGVRLSHAKLRLLRPDLYGWQGFLRSFSAKLRGTFPEKTYIIEQLQHGDSRAAVVVSTAPLLVAAYTDELDCVALLRFGDWVQEHYALRAGQRLLTVNTYKRGEQMDADLFPGPAQLGRWSGFHPIIAEFVSDDIERIDARKRTIAEPEWTRTEELSRDYLARWPGRARDGRPVFATRPAPAVFA